MTKKILLLGSGELGKELVISLKRLGQYVVAVDNYSGAPAMQVADDFEVINMLDGNALDSIVNKHKPDIIIPEVEAIRTERLFDYEEKGLQVVPSAKAANFTMNRRLIRDLAAEELKIKTARYAYANSYERFQEAVVKIGLPCVVKPLMSSSGKGQSVLRAQYDIERVWNYAMAAKRGDIGEVIVEEFIDFHLEITLLTVTQQDGPTLFCPPIGHVQERGDYMQSWQPCQIGNKELEKAQKMAKKITKALGGAGIWGVEFFLTKKGVIFSELSPRPHDTGMVTLAGSQNLSEFDLHARAVLGLPIPQVTLQRSAASSVILADKDSSVMPVFRGLDKALSVPNSDVRIFGKPNTRQYRRMGVALYSEPVGADINKVVEKAKSIAARVSVE